MTTVTPRRLIHTLLLGGGLLCVAWGALAFGSVYPWAFQPLAIACMLIGGIALVVERRGRPRIGALALWLGAVAFAIVLQLIPLRLQTMASLNPGGDEFLQRYDLSYRMSRSAEADPSSDDLPVVRHAVSIAPEQTLLGLTLYVPLAVFFLGLTRLFSITGATPIARTLTIFGVSLALIGIVQYGLTPDRLHTLIYGFWKPKYNGRPFGPFVNSNHFAGWMLMVLPVALGLFYDSLTQALGEASAYSKTRISLSNSPRIGALILLGFSVILMGVALMMTNSRSGIAAFAVGAALAGFVLWRRQKSVTMRVSMLLFCLLLFAATIEWAGVDTFLGKFSEPMYSSEGSFGGRVGAWRDTIRMMRAAPITGMGLNTFGRAMILYQTGSPTVHFQEAHNDYLQLAAEGGLLVGIPALAVLVVFVFTIRRRFRQAPKTGTTYWVRVGAVIGLISIALQSAVDFSLQMPGNAAMFALVAALAVHQSPNLKRW